MLRIAWVVPTLLLGLGLGTTLGCTNGAFSCQDDTQCPDGRCEPNGLCSFPSDDCPSGWKFGEHAGASSNQCVMPSGDETSTGTGQTSTTTTSSTTGTLDTSVTTGPATTSTSAVSGSTDSTDGASSTGDPTDPSLLLHIPFEEDFEQNGGAADVSGNGFFAQCVGNEECAQPTMGQVGQAAQFDGSDDHFRLPFDAAFNLEADYTIALWARYEPGLSFSTDSMIAKPWGTGSLNSFEVIVVDLSSDMQRDLAFKVYAGDQIVGPAIVSPMEDEAWHHIAAVRAGTQAHLYVDGALESTTDAIAINYDDHDVFIGCDQNAGNVTLHWPGAIDELRIYTRALSDAEIAELAAGN